MNYLKEYLKKIMKQMKSDDISEENDFTQKDIFYNFIDKHYSLSHLRKYNYIKYVKVLRHILKIQYENKYITFFDEFNNCIDILFENQIFPRLNIRKYFFRLDSIFIIIEQKNKIMRDTIKHIRNNCHLIRHNCINSILYKYKIFKIFSQKLRHIIENFIEWESMHGVDHECIKINNMERHYLGKKSEFDAYQYIYPYLEYISSIDTKREYFLEKNISITQFIDIPIQERGKMKGEIDGIIISRNKITNQHQIEYWIEVKSSVKSIFDDISKFIILQKYIQNFFEKNPFNIKIYKDYIFEKSSFNRIIDLPLNDWCIYMCMNNEKNKVIEKSHLYFSHILKIVDYQFIEDYYIHNKTRIMEDKYNKIFESKEYIQELFHQWKINTGIINNDSNIFLFYSIK